jgi:membrane-associated phospholipid phosphatase
MSRRWLAACLLAAVPVLAQDAPEAPDVTAGKLARNILLDQKRIWTSPFHVNRQNAKWWLIFGAATGALIATDRRTSQQLPNTGDQVAFSRGVSRVGAIYTLVPIAGGLYLGGVPSGHTLESFALASVIADQYRDNKPVVLLAYGLATMVSAARFGARQHSASDIVAGGAIGWFIGRHVAEAHRSTGRLPVNGWLSPKVIPQVQPSDHSYGVLLAWRR